jgi:hypothetical protein
MSSIATAQPPVKPATPPLVSQLAADGYLPVPPAHPSAWSARIDVGICRRMVCPTCHVRGMEYHPHHQGNRYRVAAVCKRCGHGEEV